MTSQRYPKSMRLRKSGQYRWIQRTGQKLYGHWIMLQWTLTTSPRPARLGITVSAKYGPAVARNLFKRRLKEVFRQSWDKLHPGLVIHVRPIGKVANYREVISKSDIERDWNELLAKARVLKEASNENDSNGKSNARLV